MSPSQRRSLRDRGGAFDLRIDVEAASHYLPFCTFALGLLAAAAHFICEDRASLRRRILQLIWEKVPLFALAAISAAITMAAQRADGNKMSYPLTLRLEYAIVSYGLYLQKAIWPAKLAAFLSSSRHGHAVAGRRCDPGLSADNNRRRPLLAEPAISADWVALLPWNAGAYARAGRRGLPGKTGHRGSLCVLAVHRTLHHDRLGSSGLGCGKARAAGRGARRQRCRPLEPRRSFLSPGRLLAGQCHALVARPGCDKWQLSRRE